MQNPEIIIIGIGPVGHHLVHAYTLESHTGWQRDAQYDSRKRQ